MNINTYPYFKALTKLIRATEPNKELILIRAKQLVLLGDVIDLGYGIESDNTPLEKRAHSLIACVTDSQTTLEIIKELPKDKHLRHEAHDLMNGSPIHSEMDAEDVAEIEAYITEVEMTIAHLRAVKSHIAQWEQTDPKAWFLDQDRATVTKLEEWLA